MGFQLLIGGQTYEALSFSVQEAATPLAAGDSSGQVGTVDVTIPYPDAETTPTHPLLVQGIGALIQQDVRLSDTRKGFTLGKVNSASRSHSGGSIQMSILSRMGDLNVYNVQADPFIGYLGDAFAYYLSLANITDTTQFLVDPSITLRPVVFPGWNGELWFNLKQMAAVLDCDISLVSGVILLRPIRARTATRGRDLERSFNVGGGSLAQFVEIYEYNNRQITNELVYPAGGWSEDVTIINVNAGETVEETLQISASLTSIQQPTFQTFVSRDHASSSVFTVVGDDGIPITQSAWTAGGGSLRVEINPDTASLTVRITAPVGLANKDATPIQVFGIALDSDFGTGRYSTLRIVGSGVAYDKQITRIPTGITPSETATEVGVTIDNPFISTHEDACRTGVRAVREFNGGQMSVSGNVIAMNQLGDSGEITVRGYDYVQDLMTGMTYAQVQTLWSGKTYLQTQKELNTGGDSDFDNQVFGNVAGARVWDAESKRWYRIRSGTLSPDNIQFEAEDDLTHADVQGFLSPRTYAQVQTMNAGLNYRQVDLKGMR